MNIESTLTFSCFFNDLMISEKSLSFFDPDLHHLKVSLFHL